MRFAIQREKLLKPLQLASGVVEKKQTLPILGNVLVKVDNQRLSVTATDLEVEMVVTVPLEDGQEGDITLPARKFVDICRALPDNASIDLTLDNDRAMLRSGRSRFVLSTLPAGEFPNIESIQAAIEFVVPQNRLKKLIDKTNFSMAQQDVRYYLNGLLLEITENVLRTVATDGHRLALCEQSCDINIDENQQVIIPRKGVMELSRLLEDVDTPITVQVGSNHLRVTTTELSFTTKLIDGRFPDYQRVLPQHGDKVVTANREEFRQALTRASILSNERYRSIRLQLNTESLRILANNPDQEEAEEEILVTYDGGQLEIGFNANYVMDALSAVEEDDVQVLLTDANSCCLIQGAKDASAKYVVMPMRI